MAKRVRENRLLVDDKEIQLEASIRDVIRLDDKIIALLSYEDYAPNDPLGDQNIVAVGLDGQLLWRVQDSSELFNEPDAHDSPFVGWEEKKQTSRQVLVVYELVGMCYELDTATGRLTNPQVSR